MFAFRDDNPGSYVFICTPGVSADGALRWGSVSEARALIDELQTCSLLPNLCMMTRRARRSPILRVCRPNLFIITKLMHDYQARAALADFESVPALPKFASRPILALSQAPR